MGCQFRWICENVNSPSYGTYRSVHIVPDKLIIFVYYRIFLIFSFKSGQTTGLIFWIFLNNFKKSDHRFDFPDFLWRFSKVARQDSSQKFQKWQNHRINIFPHSHTNGRIPPHLSAKTYERTSYFFPDFLVAALWD